MTAVDMLTASSRSNTPGGNVGNKLSLRKQLNTQNLSTTLHDFGKNDADLRV